MLRWIKEGDWHGIASM